MGYTFKFVKEGDRYYPNWVDMRRRFRDCWLVFIAAGPINFLAMVFLDVAFGIHSSSIWFSMFGVYAVAMFAMRIWAVNWPCPRCGKPFYRSLFVTWTLAGNCLHCGLPEYAPDDE